MENNELLDLNMEASSNDGLTADEKNYLFSSAKWAKFLGIVGFIFTGLILLAAVLVPTMGSSIAAMGDDSGVGGMFGIMGAFMGFIYLLIAAPYFFMSLFLYRFGTKMQLGLNSSSADNRILGFKNLKNYFQLIGYIMAAVLILYALIAIFGILGGLAMR